MEALNGILVSLVCPRQREHGGCEVGMAQVPLHGAEVDTGCEQRGGLGRPEGMGSAVSCADTGALCGFATSALDAASVHGRGGAGQVGLIASGGGKEPGG